MAVDSTFLNCTRGVTTAGKFTDEPAEMRFLKVPATAAVYDSGRAIRANRWAKLVISAADAEEDEIAGYTGDALFFMEGCNNDMATVLWRTACCSSPWLRNGEGAGRWLQLVQRHETFYYLKDRDDQSQLALRLVDEALAILAGAPATFNHIASLRSISR